MRVHVLVGQSVGIQAVVLGFTGIDGVSLGLTEFGEGFHLFIIGRSPVLEQIILHEFLLLALGPVEVAQPGHKTHKSPFTGQ